MTYEAFRRSLTHASPPDELSPLLKAMWFEGKGDWHMAHEVAQDIHEREGSWIHAYLHRKEGDLGNARYWYNRAGKPVPAVSLEEEWEAITRELL